MPVIRPISDMRNYKEVLSQVLPGAPVFLTRNGRGRFAIIDMDDYDRMVTHQRMVNEPWIGLDAEDDDPLDESLDASIDAPIDDELGSQIDASGEFLIGGHSRIINDMDDFD